MSTEQGWVRIHRSIFDSNIWFAERFNRAQAWIDLLLLASHKNRYIRIRGSKIELKRGQIARSMKTLSRRWQWDDRTVSKYLEDLQKEGRIRCKKSNITTVITIINYNHYQSNPMQNAAQNTVQKGVDNVVQIGEQNQRKVHTNKNVKNVDNEKNVKKSTTNVVEASPDDEWKKRLNPDVQWVMDEYESVFGRKSKSKKDRMLAKHLTNNYTRNQITAMMEYCANDQFAPRVGSVEKLWYKRGEIEEGIRKTYTKNKQNVTFAI